MHISNWKLKRLARKHLVFLLLWHSISAPAVMAGECDGTFVPPEVHQPADLLITADDIRRGYLVRGAEASVDAPHAYRIRYVVAPDATYIDQLSAASFEPSVGEIGRRSPEHRRIIFSYRLALSSSAKPG